MKLSDRAKENTKKVFRYAIQAGIIGYLAYQLYDIGWEKLVNSLPAEPLFYLLYGLIYFSLPIAEIFIYKLKWPLKWKAALPIFIQKKVLNTDVVGYSGELYLYHWAKNNLPLQPKDIAKYIKDNNVLSSIASTFITIVLLYYFVTQGYINIYDYLNEIDSLTGVAIVIGILILGGLVYRFSKFIFSLGWKDSLKVFGLHSSRIILINVLQILQWEVAKPEISMAVWFTLAVILIVSTRVPFLPSTDVLFVTVALQVSGMLDVPNDLLAGILTANLVMKRILNIVTYFIANLYKQEVDENDIAKEKEEINNAV